MNILIVALCALLAVVSVGTSVTFVLWYNRQKQKLAVGEEAEFWLKQGAKLKVSSRVSVSMGSLGEFSVGDLRGVWFEFPSEVPDLIGESGDYFVAGDLDPGEHVAEVNRQQLIQLKILPVSHEVTVEVDQSAYNKRLVWNVFLLALPIVGLFWSILFLLWKIGT